MKDFKSTLKQAREAIKNKNFETSLKLSKCVLREDKNNYMALVFLGLSLQEMGPKDQAPKAFRKAIEIDRNNPLAWNGLISYYERNEAEDNKKELIEAYITILSLETVDKKIIEFCEKLSNFVNVSDIIKISKTIYSKTKTEGLSEPVVNNIKEILVKLLDKIKDIPEELQEIYSECLMDLTNNPKTATIELYSSYLTLLNKQKNHEDILINAEKMFERYESSTISLVWICKTYNQAIVEDNSFAGQYETKVKDYVKKLLKIEPQNSMGLFTKSIFLMKENNLLEAADLLSEVTKLRPGLIHAWVLLTKLYVTLNLYDEAKQCLLKANKLLQSTNYTNEILKNKLVILNLDILSNSSDEDDLFDGLEAYKKITCNQLKENCLPYLIRIYINLNKFADAKIEISKLNENDFITKLLMSLLYYKQEKYQDALNILEKESYNDFDYWVQIGLIYEKIDPEKCLMPYLKAAKCNPNNYLGFLHLGDCYLIINDCDKSRRCYEKAFKINSNCIEAGVKLSKLYRKLKKWDSNINLLQSLTSGIINKRNSWAWLQLGLNYLEQGEYVKATDSLQFVVRVDSENPYCWEALADAYFARGSFTSALKSYERASDLSNGDLYASLQIATIKQLLGQYVEARTDFQNILLKNEQYILALKGLSETCMNQARECYRDQRLGTARDHAQYSADKISIAIQKRSELSCLWKLLADCCLFVTKLPEKYSCLLLPKAIADDKNKDGNVFLEKNDLFTFATRCYCKSIGLTENNIMIWHDLANCYLLHSVNSEDDKQKKELLKYALAAIENCILINPTSWQHWNLLGNIAMKQSPPNFSLAQHAFIKSVSIDHNCCIAWNNLGSLYLMLDDIELANKAYSQGQRSDPNYVNSWIGQALIAERIGHEEAMDLYRHSTQLAVNPQGGLGYGHWVCQTLLQSKPNENIYTIHNMHAIPVANDALTWYTEKNPNDSCAWNMLGILRERMGLLHGAEEAFKNAFRLTDKVHRDQTRINYGRLQMKVGKYAEAINTFTNVESASLKSGVGLALSLFKAGQFEDSYNAYEQALHWLTDNQEIQSDLLVALASMAYMFQGQDSAKTLLFQSIQLKPPSPWSMYSTFSLGLLHQDLNLANLILNEMENLKDNTDCLEHYSILLSYFYLLQGEHKKSIIEISKLIHRYPNHASIWLTLSYTLIRIEEAQKCAAAAKCALIAMKLGQNKMNVTKVLCLVAMASLMSGQEKQARIVASKAAHSYPSTPETWAVLSYTIGKNFQNKLNTIQEFYK